MGNPLLEKTFVCWTGLITPVTRQAVKLQPAQLALRDDSRLRRDQITQTVGRIIATNTVLICIHLQHVFRPIRIMLQRWHAFYEPRTSLVDEQSRRNPVPCIAQAMQDFSPSVHTVGVRAAQCDSEPCISAGSAQKTPFSFTASIGKLGGPSRHGAGRPRD
jgi:hypothetical protein